MAIVIFPRVAMGSYFYYIKVKVIFPEDGVVKDFLTLENSKLVSLSL